MISAIRDAREIVSFGREIVALLVDIGRALHAGQAAQAEEILRVRNREQAAGRAASEASRLAGPRSAPARDVWGWKVEP